MAPAPKFLTATETARIAGRLAGHACSPRRVRHLLVTSGLGTDIQRRTHGQTRLYAVVDVALVRLALRLEREGISPWVSRVVLTYLRNDIVRAWKAASPVALAVTGLRGSLEPALKSRPGWAAAWVPLREVWHGLDAEVQKLRDGRQTVWMWREVTVHSVPRASA